LKGFRYDKNKATLARSTFLKTLTYYNRKTKPTEESLDEI